MATYRDIGAFQEGAGPDIGAFESAEAGPAEGTILLQITNAYRVFVIGILIVFLV